MLPAGQGQQTVNGSHLFGTPSSSKAPMGQSSNHDRNSNPFEMIKEMEQTSISGPSTSNGDAHGKTQQGTPWASGSNGQDATLISDSSSSDKHNEGSPKTVRKAGTNWSQEANELVEEVVRDKAIIIDPMLNKPMDYSTDPFSTVVPQQPLNARRPWGSGSSDDSSWERAKGQEQQVFRTGLVYSSVMMLHAVPCFVDDEFDDHHPEKPERVSAVFDKLKKEGCVARMKRISIRDVVREEVMLIHHESMWEGVQRTAAFTSDTLAKHSIKLEKSSSLYVNEHSARCARLSCGGVIEMCDAVAAGRIRNGFAVVRPPGHHAEPSQSMGFCFYNNVAVATRVIQEKYKNAASPMRKILILDWDVHHGNGTQAAFYDNEDVLYISLHRYENGEFFPSGDGGNYDKVGEGKGLGKNVNIPWSEAGMGDGDYIAAFQRIVMPIACEFAPDMVIISAGFDAAKGDELGCCEVTPTCYAQMTYDLASLANGKLVVALEGGYNLDALANSAHSVTEVLLGEIPPPFDANIAPSGKANAVFEDVEKVQSRYWKSIRNPPYAALEGESTGLDKYHMGSLFALHRLKHLDAKYPDQFCALPSSRTPDADNNYGDHQIILSAGLFDDDYDALIIFAHDAGNFRVEEDGVNIDQYSELGYIVDGSSKIIDWTQANKAGLIDVTLNSQLPSVVRTPFTSINRRNRNPNQVKNISRIEQDRELLLYAWDNAAVMVLADKPETKVILVGLGTACDAILNLIEERDVANCRVQGVIQLPSYNLIPAISKNNPDKRTWYYKNSRVILPYDHVYYTLDAQTKAGKRLGRVIRSSKYIISWIERERKCC